ncbi:histidine phosphatase family protein [Tateyamaria sp. syn59]|uniref:histidine phosphatase family protein n=1 Tax=Tateyamaria sp. syn59 TaxID=2576942 RepID=UPI0011BE98C1|nr:histidine phosphatase family protein [Tateyamaria sp. syn59]
MTKSVLRYLSHPQVQINPDVEITEWSLNDVGRARIDALAAVAQDRLDGTVAVFSSPERKACDAAEPIAAALDLSVQIAPDSYENDRSSTGYLPSAEFEKTADIFFGKPEESVRGWERAVDAQTRILRSVKGVLRDAPAGDVLIVGHGAVGTLLFCAIKGYPITRTYDQGPGGGGNLLMFDRETLEINSEWQSLESHFLL